MQIYEKNDVLCGPFLIDEYDEKLIYDVIKSLTHENLMIFLMSKNFENETN